MIKKNSDKNVISKYKTMIKNKLKGKLLGSKKSDVGVNS